MKFWPLSVIAASPLVPPAYAHEVSRIATHLPSEGAFYACIDVARRTEPVNAPGLVIVESIGAPQRRVYTEYPEWDEWFRLERGAVMQAQDGFMFVHFDGLH